MAMALKGEQKDNENKMQMLDILRDDLIAVAKSLGGKIRKKKKSKSSSKLMDEDRVPTVKEAIAMLGGGGTAVEINKKDNK